MTRFKAKLRINDVYKTEVIKAESALDADAKIHARYAYASRIEIFELLDLDHRAPCLIYHCDFRASQAIGHPIYTVRAAA